jgi:D-amino-acid oxidase
MTSPASAQPASGARARALDIVVVGGGVSGLTSALELARAGHRVEIWATALAGETTSGVAAALWFPYRVYPIDRVGAWALESYERFDALIDVPGTGVRRHELIEMFPGPSPEPEWRATLRGFRQAGADQLPQGFSSGFLYDVPIVDTTRYLPWMLEQLDHAGVRRVRRTLASLDEAAAADLVVHASGMGAVELADDAEMMPVRGQIALVRGATVRRAWVDDHGPHGVRYVVPRGDDIVVGGSVEEGSLSTVVDDDTTRRLLAAGAELEPGLAEATEVVARAGVRPCRRVVRLESERRGDLTVIHNYGHGGAGITLSWGCAAEVRRRAGVVAQTPREGRHATSLGQ